MNKKRKVQLNATISPMTRQQLEILVEKDHLFASGSDAVEKSIGMMYFAVHHDILGMAADGVGVIAPVEGMK